MPKTILVTGAAGFIGYHLSIKLLQEKNIKIVGIDNLNDYYDVELKKARLLEIDKCFDWDHQSLSVYSSTFLR